MVKQATGGHRGQARDTRDPPSALGGMVTACVDVLIIIIIIKCVFCFFVFFGLFLINEP